MGPPNSKIKELEDKIAYLEKAKENAEEKQNKYYMEIKELLSQKFKEEDRRTNNPENEKELQELMRKSQLENSQILTNALEKILKQNTENANLLQKEQERREKLEKEEREKEENFRKNMIKEQEEIKNSFEEKFSQIKKDAEKKEKELEKKNQEMSENMEKLKKEYEQNIKKEKDQHKKALLKEKKKQLEEKSKKEKEANEDFKNQSEELIKKIINNFTSEFEKGEEEFCQTEISQFKKENIIELIKKLNESENLEQKVSNVLTIFSKEYSEKNKDKGINHLNIVLVGPSGVGKSTLINSMLELPKDKEAETKGVDPCTMGEPKYYESNKMPFLRLADSRGIEKGKYGVEEVVKSTENFVNFQIKKQDPDKFVHCIWYCITGTRFEDVEAESLKKLAALYDNSKLPIIVVYTQALNSQFSKEIKQKVDKLGFNLGYIDVIAKEMELGDNDPNDDKKTIIPKKGLSKLKKMSIEKAEGAVSSACYSAIKKNIIEGVSENLKNQSKKLKEYLQKTTKEKINKLQEGTDITKMTDTITSIIVEIIKCYLSGGDDGDAISIQGYNEIKNFLNKFFKESMDSYVQCFNKIINENAEKYSQELMNLQITIVRKHKGNLKTIKDKNEFEIDLKERILEKLKPKAELFCMKNAGKFISEPVREFFSKFIENKYTKMINKNDVDIIFQEEARKNFMKLDSLINNTPNNP